MITIKFIANRLKDFCNNNEKVEKFKVYIRLNFSLEIYAIINSNYSQDSFIADFQSYIEASDNCRINVNDWKLKIYLSEIQKASEDPLWQDIFEGETNCVENGPRLRFNAMLGNKKSLKINKQAPVVTFYSYKGGMGRTTTMVSYAIDLAINQNKKVCIIDCDLEAPGYLNFFNLSEHESLNSGKTNGLVEFLGDLQFSKDPRKIRISENYLINVAFGNYIEGASVLENIYLMPAGNLNEDFDFGTGENRLQYLDGLSRLNLSNESSVIRSFQILLDKINEEISPDIILIDSRTGFNDIIGTASMYLADMIVGFFGFNEQTVPGLLNIIDSYYRNNYKLTLVSSILPQGDTDPLLTKETNIINRYINLKYGSQGELGKDTPVLLPLHRHPILEKIGLSADSQVEYLNTIKSQSIQDYLDIFESISKNIFPQNKEEEEENVISSNTPAIQLRNIILKRLKETLSSIKSFAEITDVNENLFFYRNCMNELFEEKKFLICGYKGTGKTYLYKALADPKETAIATKILTKANFERKGKNLPPLDLQYKLKFVNIISFEEDGDKMFDFKYINFAQINEPEYYFNCFWQIHTWMSVLLDPEFSAIKEQSALRDYIKPIKGNADSVKRFNELINKGIDALIEIEKDFTNLNEYLISKKMKLFLMYDQLDTRINPIYWGKAVSPLISYWREKWVSYSNILPKIFIRTDLYKRIEGTNTARLEENIISIEWSIEEVFAYFFKLIFSDKQASLAFWAISEKTFLHEQHRTNVIKEFSKNDNQFITLDRTMIGPLVDIVFGRRVLVTKPDANGEHSTVNLGNPWNYFFTNLANADNKSISLRPFINMLDGNAVELALKKTEPRIKSIISPEIYASREVQLKTATTYFNDLTQDDFSKDLICVRDFINSDKGFEFRYKSLPEETFNMLIKFIFNDNIGIFKSVRNEEDLKLLLYANGIVAEKVKRGGKVYQFASMYAYSWALKSSEYDREYTPYKEGMRLKGIYSGARRSVNVYGKYYKVKKILQPVEDGQLVEFSIHIDEKKPTFMWAANVKPIEKG